MDLLDGNVLNLDVIPTDTNFDVNVLINGKYQMYEVLWGILDNPLTRLLLGPLINLLLGDKVGYQDIDFEKFAVLGNVVIQQDEDDDSNRRHFSFKEGLFVNRTLAIGGDKDHRSNLGLIGDMVAIENLAIANADIYVGENSRGLKELNIYAHGNIHIKDSCITLKNDDYKFQIFTTGKIIFEDIWNCGDYPGYIYAEGGAEFIEAGTVINEQGKVFGELASDGKSIINNYTYSDGSYSLKSLGRRFE